MKCWFIMSSRSLYLSRLSWWQVEELADRKRNTTHSRAHDFRSSEQHKHTLKEFQGTKCCEREAVLLISLQKREREKSNIIQNCHYIWNILQSLGITTNITSLSFSCNQLDFYMILTSSALSFFLTHWTKSFHNFLSSVHILFGNC